MAAKSKLDRLLDFTAAQKQKAQWELTAEMRRVRAIEQLKVEASQKVSATYQLLNTLGVHAAEFASKKILEEVRAEQRAEKELAVSHARVDQKKKSYQKLFEKEKALESLSAKRKAEEDQEESRREQGELDEQFSVLSSHRRR